MYRIIYPNNNTISIIIPTTNFTDLNNLARITVPKGLPYKIMPLNDIPQDRTFRNAWSYDFLNNDGYGECEMI